MNIICHARLPVAIDLAQLQREVNQLLTREWIAHMNRAHYNGGWDVLPLRSAGGKTGMVMPIGGMPYADTPYMDDCPYIRQLVSSMGTGASAIRLLNLKPGAQIKPHRDHDLSYEDGEMRVHIPVFTNPGVVFMLDGQRLVMEEGSCWYINANLTHSLANEGPADRIHLVIDYKVNDRLRELLGSPLRDKRERRKTLDRPATERTIRALRALGTGQGMELAAQLQQQLDEDARLAQ